MKINLKKNSIIGQLALPLLLTALLMTPVQSEQTTPPSENKASQGPAHSPLVVSFGDKNKDNVKVIMYHALNCPHCKEFKQNIFPTFKKKYIDTGIIYFEMRDFPIDALSMAAAKLAWCKETNPESYQKYSKIITDNFKIDEGSTVDVDWANGETTTIAVERLVDLMGKHGVTPEQCQICLKEKTATENHILQSCLDVQNLTNGKLDYAPGFLVNGVLVELSDLEKEIAKHRGG